ncbi:MAG: glycosyltransferase [Patescibacteria group bacterium]
MTKKNKTPLSNNSSVLFATFSKWIDNKRLPTNGSIEPLRDFLVPRVKKLVIIDQLHPGSHGVMPKIEEYRNNNMKFKTHNSSIFVYWLKPLLEMSHSENTQIRFKIRDFLSVIDWSFRDKTHFDYFIGLESVNTIAGILLRKIGRVRKVVYYVSDYSPNRYPNKWFNWLYLALDRFCAVHVDYIWDVSKAMQPARIKAGLDSTKSAPVINVPNGLYPSQIKASPVSEIDKHSMVYMGTLGQENGPDVAIEALALVKQKFPDANLHVIGGIEKETTWLKKIIKKNTLEKSVIFYGFVSSSIEMSKLIRKCAVGLAPYRDIPGSVRHYADAGKIRAYCASGLPVISSHVPPLGREVEKIGGAIIANDNSKSFANAIVKIFNDANLYLKLRRSAMLFAKNSTWENTFLNAFKQM